MELKANYLCCNKSTFLTKDKEYAYAHLSCQKSSDLHFERYIFISDNSDCLIELIPFQHESETRYFLDTEEVSLRELHASPWIVQQERLILKSIESYGNSSVAEVSSVIILESELPNSLVQDQDSRKAYLASCLKEEQSLMEVGIFQNVGATGSQYILFKSYSSEKAETCRNFQTIFQGSLLPNQIKQTL